MNLGFKIYYIGIFLFQMIGMKNLKYLNLSDNAISNVDLFAFAQLNELIILDLSRNHFNYLHSDVFIDNNKLRIVKLGGNNFHNGVPYLKNPTITVWKIFFFYLLY